MSLHGYGESDIGFTRRCNEDAIAWHLSANGHSALAVLADGIGGYKGGDVASQMAVGICMERLSSLTEEEGVEITELSDALNACVSEANQKIRVARERDPSLSQMGTTLLIVAMLRELVLVANIGDSRCYRLSHKSVNQITRDDTVAQAMVDDGSISKSEMSRVPFKNVLTKALGSEPDVTADIQQVFLEQDELLLLCSDGLTGAVDTARWPTIIGQQKGVKQQVECLIDESLNNRANDNVSVILMHR